MKRMALTADKKDYYRGFRKHSAAYNQLKNNNDSIISRRLLLVYSVECGLKNMLLEKRGILSASESNSGLFNERHNVLYNHDIRLILKEIGQEGLFEFPSLKTVHSELVDEKRYHEVYRYGIKVSKDFEKNEKEYEKVLNSILVWIEE